MSTFNGLSKSALRDAIVQVEKDAWLHKPQPKHRKEWELGCDREPRDRDDRPTRAEMRAIVERFEAAMERGELVRLHRVEVR